MCLGEAGSQGVAGGMEMHVLLTSFVVQCEFLTGGRELNSLADVNNGVCPSA